MKVTQVSIGRFHHFHLARQMERFGLLEALWTGYPHFKLGDETGIPRDKIRSFPWLHTVYMAWSRLPLVGRSDRARHEVGLLAQETLDRRVAWSLDKPTVLVALSGQGRRSGRRAQALGGRHVCDRGSSHIRYQDEILREEHGIWRMPYTDIDPRTIDKEETEYAQADLITVPSGFAERSFLSKGVAPEKLRRIPYGARLERFRPTGKPSTETFTILFVGHVSLRKGVPYLLEAFSRFDHPNKRLVVVGNVDEAMRPMLAAHASDRIDFVGNLSNAELPDYYSTANVLVLPSIEEGLAMVMAEALSCGCPVIASQNTGAEDLFRDGEEGFIIPIRSADAILRALETLANTPDLAATMRAAAQARMQALDGWNTYGKIWHAVISGMERR